MRKSYQPHREWRTDSGGDRGWLSLALERECPVQEERGRASQREAHRKQPEGPMGRRKRYGWCLAIMQGESIVQAGACLAQGHKHQNVRPVIREHCPAAGEGVQGPTGAGKDGKMRRNPYTPSWKRGIAAGAGMEGPGGCAFLGSCARRQLSPRRLRQGGRQPGPETPHPLQTHFKHANQEQGREWRNCQPPALWGSLQGEGGSWREADGGRARGRWRGARGAWLHPCPRKPPLCGAGTVSASQRQQPESTFSEHLLCAMDFPRSRLNFWLYLPKAGVICRARRCSREREAAHTGHPGD